MVLAFLCLVDAFFMNFMCYGIDIGWSESCQIEKFKFLLLFFSFILCLLELREKTLFYVGNWKGDW